MKNFVIKRNFLIVGVIVWWLVFAVLSMEKVNNFQTLNIVGFLFLLFIPGMLTVVSLRLKEITFWASLSLSVAFSLLELMVMALIGNFLLPKFGMIHPLEQNILLMELNITIAILSCIAWKRLDSWEFNILERIHNIFPSKLDFFLSFFPVVFVIQSIAGSFILNNGGGGITTLCLLGEIAFYILFLYLFVKKLGDNAIPIALYFISLSLLLMSSLRGWYITGHDIQSEYMVFELAKNSGIWNIGFYHDAYNACLSITILPTIFFNLLKFSDPYVYKFFFQLIFPVCSGVVYLISRHFAKKSVSLAAGLFFISFPTFFADMPFLNRQEIAFVFYGLMLYFIFEKKLDIVKRQLIFIILGLGVIISHYSTTYTTLLVFSLAVIVKPLFVKFFNILSLRLNLFKNSSLLYSPKQKMLGNDRKITYPVIVFLFVASFFWTSIVTNTGGNLSHVLKETTSAIKSGFSENNRSTDALNLISFRKPSQQKELEDFIDKFIKPLREKEQTGVYYNESTYSKYKFIALPDEEIPMTKIGNFVQKRGVDVKFINVTVGRTLTKLMEILAPLGIVFLLFRKRLSETIDDEFYLMAIFSLFFISLNIFIPVLSTEYGIFRALQQSMFVLALPMIVGMSFIGVLFGKFKQKIQRYFFKIKFINKKNSLAVDNDYVIIILVLVFFMYSTTFLPQLFGKTPAMLYLSNTGRYYDNYLIKTAEIYGVTWLQNLASSANSSISGVKIKIQSDRYSKGKIASIKPIDVENEIFPGLVRKDAYVFLGKAVTTKQRETLVYGGDQITYTYPVKFLDDNKNLIYNNGEVKIYR